MAKGGRRVSKRASGKWFCWNDFVNEIFVNENAFVVRGDDKRILINHFAEREREREREILRNAIFYGDCD